MNKKIILSLGSALLLTSSLFAANMNCPNPGMCPQKNNNKMMMSQRHSGKHTFISKIMQLDLSDDQRAKIRDIMRENMAKMPKPSTAFSETGFDKELFIKLSEAKRDNKIQNRADMIERVYNLLDASQKKALKESFDRRRSMMQQRNMNR